MDVSYLKEDITKLKSQIVESPEELKTQMEKMREQVKNIKSSIVSAKHKLCHNLLIGFGMTYGIKLCVCCNVRKRQTSVWWSCRAWGRT